MNMKKKTSFIDKSWTVCSSHNEYYFSQRICIQSLVFFVFNNPDAPKKSVRTASFGSKTRTFPWKSGGMVTLLLIWFLIYIHWIERKISPTITKSILIFFSMSYLSKFIFLPFNSFTIPVIMSWISGLACLPRCACISDWVTIFLVIVALGVISWGSCNALAWGAPRPSPDSGTFVCSREGDKTSLS